MQQVVFDALDAIYDAALNPDGWPDALQKIADCFGDVGTVLLFQRDDGSIGLVGSASLDAVVRDYDQHWREQDIRTYRGIERALDTVTDRHVVTPEEIDTHPFYTQFLAGHGLGWFAAAAILPSRNNSVWFVVQRRKSKPPFSDDELSLLLRIGRHAENSLRLGFRLLNAEALNHSLMQMLSAMDYGVVLLDENRKIVFKTPKAQQAMAAGLSLRKVLGPNKRRKTRDLLVVPPDGIDDVPMDFRPILVERPDGKPFVLYALPVRPDVASAAFAMFGTVRTIIIIVDTAKQPSLDPSLLRDLFGLTLAEARVASLVGSGTTAQTTAERLGVAEDTVRKALKSIFAKTGVSRQTELALLLSRLPVH